MRILDIAAKDIQQILRDWKSALFLLVMPVLFTVFFGLVFGPVMSADRQRDPRLPVGLDQPGSGRAAERQPGGAHGQSDVIRPVVLDQGAAEQAS